MINDPYSHRLKPPLDDDQLRDMWVRNRSPEVHALLWEVKRLQNIVRRAWQFQTFFPPQGYLGGSTRDMVLCHLRDELKDEPYRTLAVEQDGKRSRLPLGRYFGKPEIFRKALADLLAPAQAAQ
uniref:hypothetical protein n=1 Tax=Cupriavidus necator TaxID=106590 RepID=UPI003F49B25F